MKKFLKRLGISLGVILVLFIIALIVIPFVFDPNDYKDEIQGLAKTHTGRDLKLAGNIELSLFPWVGVQLGETQLSNAAGFGDKPFAAIKSVDVRVKLMPLLDKKIELGKVVLHGLDLNLQRDKKCVSNWDDLAKQKTTAAPAATETPTAPTDSTTPPPPGGPLAGLSLGGVEITNANIAWDDQCTNQSYHLQDVHLEVGALSFTEAMPISLSARLDSDSLKLKASVALSASIKMNQELNRFNLSNFSLTPKAEGAIIPGNQLDASFQLKQLDADLVKQTLLVQGLQLEALGIGIFAEKITGTDIIKAPRFKGALRIADFSPKQLLDKLKITLPAMADANVMQKAALHTRFDAGLKQARLDNLKLALDDTWLQGRVSLLDFKLPNVQFDLQSNGIDVDRYLPPKSAQPAAKTAVETSVKAQATDTPLPLPITLLRSMIVDGHFEMARVKVAGLEVKNININLAASNGQLGIKPISADVYKGTFKGEASLNVVGDLPVFSVKMDLDKVEAQPLVKQLIDHDIMTGNGNVHANIRTQGASVNALMRNLNGTANFSFLKGSIKGIDIPYSLEVVKAMIAKKPKPAEPKNPQTPLGKISASMQIKNGVAHNRDMELNAPNIYVAGKGTVDIVNKAINYRVEAYHTPTQNTKAKIKDLIPVPIILRGPFAKLEIKPDYQYAVNKWLEIEKRKLQKQAGKEVQKQIDKKRDELKKSVEDKLKNLLRF